jgi:hypothetical protein
MRVYTVHGGQTGGDEAATPLVLVREGFSWPALLLPFLWLAWHGLWLAAALCLAVLVGIGALAPEFVSGPATLAVHVLIGAHAQDLRRRRLRRRGQPLTGIVAERDRERAMVRLLAERPELAAPLARAALA